MYVRSFSPLCSRYLYMNFHSAAGGAMQVAERSLFLWNNEAIVGLVAQHRSAVVPAVVPALERNARSHWNPAVHGLTVNVRKMFQEIDGPLYEQCRQRFEHEEVIPLACWRRCFRTSSANERMLGQDFTDSRIRQSRWHSASSPEATFIAAYGLQ